MEKSLLTALNSIKQICEKADALDTHHSSTLSTMLEYHEALDQIHEIVRRIAMSDFSNTVRCNSCGTVSPQDDIQCNCGEPSGTITDQTTVNIPKYIICHAPLTGIGWYEIRGWNHELRQYEHLSTVRSYCTAKGFIKRMEERDRACAVVYKDRTGWWVAITEDTSEKIGDFHDNELDAFKAANRAGYLVR